MFEEIKNVVNNVVNAVSDSMNNDEPKNADNPFVDENGRTLQDAIHEDRQLKRYDQNSEYK